MSPERGSVGIERIPELLKFVASERQVGEPVHFLTYGDELNYKRQAWGLV